MSGIGHLAAGFAAKPTNPQIPLWVLLIAAESNDILYGVFMAIGLEPKVGMTMNFTDGVRYATPATDPFSHGLFMSIVWSLLAITIGYVIYKKWRPGLVLGAVVFSHWILDFLMHSNLPLFFNGSPLIGLGLENTGIGFLIMTIFDLVIVASAVAYYISNRKKNCQSKTV
jgi:hypothetical protein